MMICLFFLHLKSSFRFQDILDFLVIEKSYTKCVGETIPRPFSKKAKLSISPDQLSKIVTACRYCMLISGLLKYIETKLQTTCFNLI